MRKGLKFSEEVYIFVLFHMAADNHGVSSDACAVDRNFRYGT